MHRSCLVIFFIVLMFSTYSGAADRIRLVRETGDCISVAGQCIFWFYVNPDPALGSDTNDCRSVALPCLTRQATYHKITENYDFGGGQVYVQLADGTYTDTLQVLGSPLGVRGVPLVRWLGNEQDKTAVRLRPPNGASANSVADFSVGVFKHMTCETGNCFFGRQHAILDLENVNFGAVLTAISATQHTDVSITGEVWISGGMHVFIGASEQSRVGLYGAHITFKQNVTVDYLMLSYRQSLIDLNGAVFVSPERMSGLAYIACWDGALMKGGLTLPGTVGSNIAYCPPDAPGKLW